MRNERGVAMIMALMVAMILAIMSGSMLSFALSDYRTSQRHLNLTRAIYVGEAGVDAAINTLRANPNYAGTNYVALGNNQGGYTIQVVADGPDRRIIRANGFYPTDNPADYGYTAKTIEAAVQMVPGGGPGDGVVGDRSIRVSGELTMDSYDSRQPGGYDRSRARSNVRVRINADAPGSMQLSGRITIRGDAVLGPGSDPARTLQRTPGTTITGFVSVASSTAPLGRVETSGGESVRVSGTEVRTYDCTVCRFHDLRISGQGKVVFTQPNTVVFVENNVEISGQGIATAGNLPTNLTMNVRGSQVAISGNADLYAKLYAPQAQVAVSGNGSLFGSVTGRHLAWSGRGNIHYDEALNQGGGGGGNQVTLLSWREWTP